MLKLFGIKNCDTIRKARAWLDVGGHAHIFHDYKVHGIDPDMLQAWMRELGWEAVLNRTGTTFRKLPEEQRQALNMDRAMALMLAQPSMIRRPVLDLGNQRVVGFTAEVYARALKPS